MSTSDLTLNGKTILVTGGGSVAEGYGTGKATAILAARLGAQVVVLDHEKPRADATVTEIEIAGGAALAVAADVTKPTDCRRAVAEALSGFGGVDCLVNNIGISAVGTVEDIEPDTWDRVMDVNVKAMYLMAREAVPALRKSGTGSIVNISSIGAILPNVSTPLTAYSASKGAVEALTRALAVDHGKDGIRANTVAPGPIFTPRQVARGLTEETRTHRRKLALTETEGTAWDIANAVCFLASDWARWVNGIVLPVDGGVSIRGHSYR